MPRARKLPFLLFAQQDRGDGMEGVVIQRRGDNVQLEHINVVGVELTQGVLEARHDLHRRNGYTCD